MTEPVVVNRTVRVYPKQRQFLESKALLRAFAGGIGSGKSYIGALDVIRRARPGRLYMVTAPTYPMLADATFRSVADMARELDVATPQDVKTSPPQSIRLRTGAEIIFRSTDNPEMLRGPNLSGIWMDEASLSKQEAFDILIGRLREGGEQGWLTATFTPKGRTHWTYKTFANEDDPDVELVRAKSSENPFLPKTFVEHVRKRYTLLQADQELGGAFVEAGGAHYHPEAWPRYLDMGDAYQVRLGDRYRHVRKEDCSRLLTLDWAMGKPKNDARSVAARATGITDNLKGDSTAFLIGDLDNETGFLYLLWALCERVPLGQNAPRLAETCRRWLPLVVAGDDDNLSETMQLETRRYRDIPSVKPVPIGGKNKLVRSQASIVRAERGEVFLPHNPRGADAEWVEKLCDQLSTFSGADGESDDLADAFSIMGRLADEFTPGEDVADVDPSILVTDGYQGTVFPSGAHDY